MTAHRARRTPDHRTRVGRERSARTETRILEAALRGLMSAMRVTPRLGGGAIIEATLYRARVR